MCDACQCEVVCFCAARGWCCLITRSKNSGQSSNVPTRIGDRYFENLSVVKCGKEQEQTQIMFMMKVGSGSNSQYICCPYDENLSLSFLARNTNIKTGYNCTCLALASVFPVALRTRYTVDEYL